MNDTTQKIAEEAASELWDDDWSDEDAPAFHQCAIKHFQSAIEKGTDFYKRRCDALQQAQKEMRDPERQIVCDILANGFRDKAIEKSRAAHASEQGAKRHELLERIQDYLAKGGLFNPELMEADKVQRLIMDCRTYIVQHERAAHSSERDLLDLAWGIIANAGGGDWTKESKEWQDAAAKWRDRYKVLPAAHASEQ